VHFGAPHEEPRDRQLGDRVGDDPAPAAQQVAQGLSVDGERQQEQGGRRTTQEDEGGGETSRTAMRISRYGVPQMTDIAANRIQPRRDTPYF